MKIVIQFLLPIVMLASSCAWAESDQLPLRDDYAYGFGLETSGNAEFFELEIPLEVYRSVADPRLRDSGVYNADGQAVPRIIERPESDEVSVEQSLPLGLIPLFGPQAKQADQLRLLLHRDANSTRLELDSDRTLDADRDENGKAGGQALTGYLLDFRELEEDLQQLELSWNDLPEGFMGTVWLEDSDDLQHWRRLGSSALAELEFEETRIKQNRLLLPSNTSDFLRISLQNLPPEWRLASVRGIYTGQGPQAAREWLELEQPTAGDSDREYLFDSGAYLPVDQLNLVLPDDNVVLRASIYYRTDKDVNWRLAHNGIFYNISRRGNTLQSAAVSLYRSRQVELRASQWKVRIDSGVASSPPVLKLGWRADRLSFLAQGAPPFELVSGRADDELQQFPQEKILGDHAIFRMLRKSGEAGVASVGARVLIGGPGRLQISETPNWRVLLVWAGLIGATGLVGWLVLSLMREMKQEAS